MFFKMYKRKQVTQNVLIKLKNAIFALIIIEQEECNKLF